MQKVHLVASHAVVAIAGAAELGNNVIDLAKKQMTSGGIDGVTPVMATLRNTAISNFNEWFQSVPPIQPVGLVQMGQVATRPDLGFLIAGYDGDEARIYNLGSQQNFAPNLNSHGFAIAGVAQYALYLLNRLYEPGRSIQDLMSLAAYVITETAGQDGKVGGPVMMATIKPVEGATVVAPEDVQGIIDRNIARHSALKGSFYEENH